jgi:tetratricopeptide (TPR) repeat protein
MYPASAKKLKSRSSGIQGAAQVALITGLLADTGVRGRGLLKVREFFVVMLIAAAIVEIVGASGATSWSRAAAFILLNMVLGGAAGLFGAVLGFIFGIPRAFTDEASASSGAQPRSTAANRRSRPNTNLEQISDWLTKILVGASLASLANVPHFTTTVITFLDANAYQNLPGGGTLAVFIFVYFSFLGFYWSYIETRTTLTELIDTYQGDGQLEDVLLRVRSAPWDPGSAPIPEDEEVLALDQAALTTPALLEARAGAETRGGRYSEAIRFYRQALDMDPGNPRLQTRLSFVLAAAGDPAAADRIVQRLQAAAAGNPAQQNQLDLSRVHAALYKPPPQGFEEAIRIGEPLLQTEQASNGLLQLWMACAYGQQARFRQQPGKAIPNDDSDRRRALERLREMKRLRPDLIPQARSLWHPDSGSTEDDLAVFSDDPEFAELLAGS